MYAIASLLDPESDKAVQVLWRRFEDHCGLTGIKLTPTPHFSWQGAQDYQLERVETVLAQAAAQVKPFRVMATGLGIFTGIRPVVYIPLVKNEEMIQLHRLIWEQAGPYALLPNPYYEPTRWVPHISLALYETDPYQLACAVADIAFQAVEFEIIVNHLAIIYLKDGKTGVLNLYDMNKQQEAMGGI